MGNDSESWKEASIHLKKIWLEDAPVSDGREFLAHARELGSKKEILLRSAKKYGTPQYILDEEKLIAQIRQFSLAFKRYAGDFKVFYAFKCNDLPWMLKIMIESGVNADVAGLFELKLAIKLGFDHMIFTSPGKSDEELLLAIENRDKVIINIDNLDELSRIVSLAEKRFGKKMLAEKMFTGKNNKNDKNNKNNTNKITVSFRINFSESAVGAWSKFGIPIESLADAVRIVKNTPFLSWEGIHFHSSWNDTPERYVDGIEKLSDYLGKNFSRGELEGLKFIDIGGGFMPDGSADLFSGTDKGSLVQAISSAKDMHDASHPEVMKQIVHTDISSIDEFAKQIGKVFNEEFKHKLSLKDISLWAEPGRFLVSSSTSILFTVQSVKGGSLIVDGGINLVGGHDFEHTFFPILNVSQPSSAFNKSTIYGPLCDPYDFWGYYYFGSKAKVGDVLAVMHQGAYTYATAWKFIKPIAKYVAFGKDGLKVVKDEERFEDRYGLCKFE